MDDSFDGDTVTHSLPRESLGLYLHIPFCRHRCSYCDFNTYTTLDSLKEDYVSALCEEITIVGEAALKDGSKRQIGTIYFGGGTPSLLSVSALARLLNSVRASFDLAEDAEVSLEANPGTTDNRFLEDIRKLGIDRLSFGAQSAIPAELTMLQREHDFAAVTDAVAMSRAAGFASVNLDLIFGLPGQTLRSWQKSLQAALALRPDHLSLYCLTIEAGTPMHRWLNDGAIKPPEPDLAADQYELACALLAGEGFQHYEISNWCLPGHECRHNLVYWRNQEYLGMGAGAHGHAGGYRYELVKQPRTYIRRMLSGHQSANGQVQFPLSAAVSQQHRVERTEAMSDTMINQLRLLQEGLDLRAFRAKFDQTPDQAFQGAVQTLIELGLLSRDEGRLRLTKHARFLSNQVFYRFV